MRVEQIANCVISWTINCPFPLTINEGKLGKWSWAKKSRKQTKNGYLIGMPLWLTQCGSSRRRNFLKTLMVSPSPLHCNN